WMPPTTSTVGPEAGARMMTASVAWAVPASKVRLVTVTLLAAWAWLDPSTGKMPNNRARTTARPAARIKCLDMMPLLSVDGLCGDPRGTGFASGSPLFWQHLFPLGGEPYGGDRG